MHNHDNTEPSKRTVSVSIPLVVLCVDSDYEEVTKQIYEYRKTNVYPYLEKKGLTLLMRQGALARRIYVAPEASKPSVHYITGVGHGTPASFTGDYFDPIFALGSYSSDEVDNKLVHFVACQTAQKLGPDFVSNGCKAYFGYDENFLFDPATADVFLECDSEIDRGIADGLDAGGVYDRVVSLFDQRISELRNAGRLQNAAVLEFNKRHLRAPSNDATWGDTNARLP